MRGLDFDINPWSTEPYNHPVNPNNINPLQIQPENRNPNLYSMPNVQPIEMNGINENGSPNWKVKKKRVKGSFDPTDLIYGLNIGMRGVSNFFDQQSHQQYLNDNIANPLASLPLNDGRSDDVAFGYQQFKKGGLQKYPEGGKMPIKQFQETSAIKQSPMKEDLGGNTDYDTIPSYLYYIKAAQENNAEGMQKALDHVNHVRGIDAASSLNALGSNLKISNINNIAKRSISSEKNPEMRKLYSMVNENPDIVNNFQYGLPDNNNLAKFAYGGSNFRNKVLDYLYSDDEDDNNQAVVSENTAPSTDEVDTKFNQDDEDELINSILDMNNEPENPYKAAREAFAGTGSISKPSSNFRSFSSPEEGRKALIDQLKLYQTGKTKNPVNPNSSLYQAMSVYAPASDNNNPKQYAEFIAKKIGINPNTPIRGIDLNKWADAITQMEGNKSNNPGNLRPYKR